MSDTRRIIWSGRIPGKQYTVNHIYAQSRSGRRFMTKDGKAYKKMVANLAATTHALEPSDKALAVEIDYVFPNRLRRDVTNYEKPLLDSLEGIIYLDDTQIYDCHLKKQIIKGEQYTDIRVYEIE